LSYWRKLKNSGVRKTMQNLMMLVALLTFVAAPSLVQAKDCPTDARNASFALWPGATIPTGKTVEGTPLASESGVPGNFSSRHCYWE
jgi:hypothetical protein